VQRVAVFEGRPNFESSMPTLSSLERVRLDAGVDAAAGTFARLRSFAATLSRSSMLLEGVEHDAARAAVERVLEVLGLLEVAVEETRFPWGSPRPRRRQSSPGRRYVEAEGPPSPPCANAAFTHSASSRR